VQDVAKRGLTLEQRLVKQELEVVVDNL